MTDDDTIEEGGTGTAVEERVRVKKPRLYKVLMLNDDYTTMDFVISVLETIFQKGPAEANKIMMHIHNRGSGLCGVYTKEIAETKVDLVHTRAMDDGFPLRCSIEPEE
jgi:ATP-dependent Clp protease adaptor protein ClpS